jgi:hypothetical protein
MTTPIWLRRTGRTLNNNSTSILSAAAVGGVVVTAILTVKATKKTVRNMDEIITPGDPGVTPREVVERYWKNYIPPAAAGLATIGCIVGANHIGLRRQAAMLGAYTLADTAFREYKEEVVSLLGDKKDQAVTDKIAARKIDENPPVDNQVIITGGGDHLCFDTLSGRYFTSDIESIRRAANDANEEIIGGNMWCSLNEFWARLGLAETTLGEELGFNLEHLVELQFTPHLAKNGEPCLAVTHVKLPVANYGQVV